MFSEINEAQTDKHHMVSLMWKKLLWKVDLMEGGSQMVLTRGREEYKKGRVRDSLIGSR